MTAHFDNRLREGRRIRGLEPARLQGKTGKIKETHGMSSVQEQEAFVRQGSCRPSQATFLLTSKFCMSNSCKPQVAIGVIAPNLHY